MIKVAPNLTTFKISIAPKYHQALPNSTTKSITPNYCNPIKPLSLTTRKTNTKAIMSPTMLKLGTHSMIRLLSWTNLEKDTVRHSERSTCRTNSKPSRWSIKSSPAITSETASIKNISTRSKRHTIKPKQIWGLNLIIIRSNRNTIKQWRMITASICCHRLQKYRSSSRRCICAMTIANLSFKLAHRPSTVTRMRWG